MPNAGLGCSREPLKSWFRGSCGRFDPDYSVEELSYKQSSVATLGLCRLWAGGDVEKLECCWSVDWLNLCWSFVSVFDLQNANYKVMNSLRSFASLYVV